MKHFMWLCLFLSGCAASFEPVEQAEYAAVLSIKDPALTFVGSDGQPLAKWPLESGITGAVLAGDDVILYGPSRTKALVYSVSTGTKKDEWNVPPGVEAALFLPDRDEVVFASNKTNAVHFFQLSGNEVTSVPTGQYPVSLTEYGGRLFVVHYEDTVLSVIDLEKRTVSQEMAIPTSSTGVAVLPERKEVWVGGHGYGVEAGELIHRYALDTGELNGTADAPVMPIAFHEDDGSMFVASHGSSQLYQFDAAGKKQAESKAPANPFSVQVFADYVLAAGYDSGTVAFYERDTLQKTMEVTVPGGPFQLIVKEAE